jgi:hypothetical protein
MTQGGKHASRTGQSFQKRKKITEAMNDHAVHYLINFGSWIMRGMDEHFKGVGQPSGEFIDKRWICVIFPSGKR